MDQVIAFASLFLGLLTGPHQLQVVVGQQVAAVEMFLDGAPIGTVDAEPWTLQWDFGSVPRPTILRAVARDAEGEQIGAVEQWLNVPRPPAEVQVVLDEQAEGTVARLSWKSLEASAPIAVEAILDDQPLEVLDPTTIPLPPSNPEQIHLLRIELRFSEQLSAVADVTFGGFYLDRVQADLSALPVVLTGRRDPALEQLGDAVEVAGSPARVVAIERGPIDLVVVRDESALVPLRELLQREARDMRSHNKSPTNTDTAGRLRRLTALPSAARLHFLFPYPAPPKPGADFQLYPRSEELSAPDGGFFWLLAQMSQPHQPGATQHLADAVAVAGMNAARRDRRRAVLLVLGPSPVDGGRLTPAAASSYLAALHVPLTIWTLDATATSDWGAAVDVSSPRRLTRAASDLADTVSAQRLLWIEGRHLPTQIALREGAAQLAPLRRGEP